MNNEVKFSPLIVNCTMIDLSSGDYRQRELGMPFLLGNADDPNSYIVISAENSISVSSHEL